jgi:putative restriction endonuclease
MPLSITTVPATDRKAPPYPDEFGANGLLFYRYQGTDPFHRDNVGLRLARQRRVPLVYFVGTVEGWYEAIWPVYVVDDDPARLTFTVVADAQIGLLVPSAREPETELVERRRYVTREVQQRLHQQLFRAA